MGRYPLRASFVCVADPVIVTDGRVAGTGQDGAEALGLGAGDDLAPGALNSILKQAGLMRNQGKTMRYAVVIENAGSNFSAYVPDLPGCVAIGTTLAEVEVAIRQAIEFHVDGLRADGSPIPPPSSTVEYVEVAA